MSYDTLIATNINGVTSIDGMTYPPPITTAALADGRIPVGTGSTIPPLKDSGLIVTALGDGRSIEFNEITPTFAIFNDDVHKFSGISTNNGTELSFTTDDANTSCNITVSNNSGGAGRNTIIRDGISGNRLLITDTTWTLEDHVNNTIISSNPTGLVVKLKGSNGTVGQVLTADGTGYCNWA